MITTRCSTAEFVAPRAAPTRPCFRKGNPGGSALALLVFALFATCAPAQDVSWRYDYNSARKEAAEKNRPLLLDFGTEHCFWCAKLDSTTFKDPEIARVLNQQFIPLKVDAEKNPLLTQTLQVQSFPTLVLAAPDGKILGTLEGYMPAERLQGSLQQTLVNLTVPEWMTRAYEDAARAVSGSEYARAIALLKSVVEDGKDRPVQQKARQLLVDLEQQAANRLAHARQLGDKGQNSEALNVLAQLLKAFPGTQAAAEGGQMLSSLALKPEVKTQQRGQRARELLAQAREDYRTQQYLCCIDRCELLASTYGDLPEGAEASQLVAEIKNNPEWMQQACEGLSDRLGGLYLSLAETWLKKGQPNQAILCLEKVIHSLPGTRQAEAAQVRLAQILGQPTRQADFKK